MASQADITIVRDNLPTEALGDGWSDEKIALLLDSPMSTSRAIRQYWSYRAAATASYVSVNESGSSRNLAEIHKHALEMLKYWDDRIKEEEAVEEAEDPSAGRVAFHRITRV